MLVIFLTSAIKITNYTYFDLGIMAVKFGVISTFVVVVVNLIFNRSDINNLIDLLKKRR